MDKINYKDTLNLPQTSFSMKANLPLLEPRILSEWHKLNIYQVLRQARKGKDKFVLHDGPPYANGLIHIGHALNMILKDIVIKYMALKGKDVPFVVGWDCHGLPVEHQLLKELKLTKHDIKVDGFRKKAKDFALKFVELQKKDFERLGVFGAFDEPYLTLNPEYEYYVIKLLEYLVQEGYVYRGLKPVNWCSKCETALAEAEVEYENHTSPSIYVKFKAKELTGPEHKRIDIANCIKEAGQRFQPKDIYFVIWTTTPWTLISNVAIALHPQEKYCCLVQSNGEAWVVADKLKSCFLKSINRQEQDFDFIWTAQGKDWEGSTYEHPFNLRQGKVVTADYVSMQDGTGCVHTAPGHGQEDYLTGKKYGLEIVMPVDSKGRFDESAGEWKGMHVHSADKEIIAALNSKGLLLSAGKIEHSYPHCWRCKGAIIYRATSQWFLNIDHNDLRHKLLKEIENVRWVPAQGLERMRGMLLVRPDWCLSRQRLWGIPIPAVKCRSCNEVILAKEVIEKSAEVFKVNGSDSWFIFDIGKFLPQEFSCPKCKGKNFEKEFDILDVWFESGASFFAVVKQEQDLQFPADMYLEGSDQHRGWFQVSLIPSVAKEKTAPFKTILTHGFVVDGEGRKMSKSLGNVVAPQEIIKQYGAELLRLWVAYSDYSEDVKISDNIIKQLVDIYRKVRNTIKFILGNLADFDLARDSIEYAQLLEVDRLMLSKTALFSANTLEAYENYAFYRACQEIFNFCNLDLSAFYLDILKDRLYTFSPNSRERRSAQFVLYHILDALLKFIAPILSFTAEEAYLCWQSRGSKEASIFTSLLSEVTHPEWLDKELNQRWETILKLRDCVLKEIEKERAKGIVGSSLEAEVFLEFAKNDYEFYRGYADILREVFIVSGVWIKEGNSGIRVEKTKNIKCLRCWNHRSDVGSVKEFAGVCVRCATVLNQRVEKI
jgi:isoleucyl-tRNA synthetase